MKIAIAIIHGVGNQDSHFADEMINELKTKFEKEFSSKDRKNKAGELVFEPIYWADVLKTSEERLWNKVTSHDALDYVKLRRFIMNFAADAIAYQPGKSREDVYFQIHKKVANAFAKLAKNAGKKAPLCIIGHSLGTIITHNYFYDLHDTSQESRVTETAENSSLETGDTLSLFFTMGSPLALWSLRYSFANEYAPIQFPGKLVKSLYKTAQPKWVNFYDNDDVLAYPIGNLTEQHEKLVKDGLLQDKPINAGSILVSWNPASHVAYWTDDDVTNTIAHELADLWKKINMS